MPPAPKLDLGPIAHLDYWAKHTPDQLAIRGPNLSLSYSKLQAEVRKAAAWLRAQDISGGVLINATQVYERIYALALVHEGLFSAGLTDQLSHQDLKGLGFEAILSNTAGISSDHLRVLNLNTVSAHELATLDLDLEPATLGEQDLLRVIFSSGTTGKPKPTGLTTKLQRHRVEAAGSHYMRQAPFFVLVGFRTVAGNTCLFLDLWRGATNLIPGDSAWNARQLVAMGIKGLMGSPIALEGVANEFKKLTERDSTGGASKTKDSSSKLELEEVVSAGSFVNPRLARDIAETFDCKVTNVYGSTEAGLIGFSDATLDPNDLCELYPNVEVRIVDDQGRELPQGELGKILLNTPYLNNQYLGEELNQNNLFEPGDMGMLTSSGQLKIAGREDDLINLSGLKIDPRPIEIYVMNKYPGSEAVCILATDQDGRNYHLMLLASKEQIDLVELKRDLFTVFHKLAPQAISPVNNIARNEMGKVPRRALINTKK